MDRVIVDSQTVSVLVRIAKALERIAVAVEYLEQRPDLRLGERKE